MIKTCRYIALLATLLVAVTSSVRAASCLVEGEAFQFKGKWVVEKSSECLGTAMLRVWQDNDSSPSSDALTVVSITEEGTYKVWVRSQDYTGSLRPRTFTLSVDGKEMSPSGAHGYPAFRWECVGEVDLKRKETLLRLSDTGGYYGRCDAILLTTDTDIDPNAMTNVEIARWRRNPVVMAYSDSDVPSLSPSLEITAGYTTLASASNDEVRLSFVKLPDNDGMIVCKTDYYADGSWRRYAGSREDNRVAILSGTENQTVNYNNFYPSWSSCHASRSFSFDGETYPVNLDGDRGNPFFAGMLAEARVSAVTKTASNVIKVTYDCGTGSLVGYWTVPENGTHISVRFVFKPLVDGWYSLVLHGGKGVPENKVRGVLMPPMFCGPRLPESPQMLFSSMMTQCVSAVETSAVYDNTSVTSFIAADLSSFPEVWGGYDSSPVGFCLRNSENDLQAVAVAPLPGMSDSRIKAGRSKEVRFVTGLHAGTWGEALAYVSDSVFRVRDYRRPVGCSLTETVHNIVTLLKDDEASGWAPSYKGFWDIEADGSVSPTVVQAAPLALVGASALLYDEELYEKRALPTIEYVLSRLAYRTRANDPRPLSPQSSQFPTTLYEGIHSLMGGLNPWMAALALPDGEIRSSNGYFSTLQPLSQELAAYRLTGDETRIDKARTYADGFVTECMSGNPVVSAPGTFYNSQMCTDWTPLLDIYKLTGEERYLAAAVHAASYTLAGVRTWPQVGEGAMTVHPGGRFDGVTTIWWKGAEPWRLGFPRQEGDAAEHEVEAWTVSPVGLGIEQPATYFVRTSGKNARPVYMNSWAPRLCDLAGLSGQRVFETYGRNAVVGRAENYPGYYATGFTDIVSSARFPYEGPDVSSIYFHHIPAYLAMVQDFLVTEMTVRSKGNVSFPCSRQEGFVWFANNIYGMGRGEIFGDSATLWMPRGAVSVDETEINVLTARNESAFYIMLSNDGLEDVRASVSLAPEIMARLLVNKGSAVIPGGSTGSVDIATDGRFKADVPVGEMAVISIPADFNIPVLPTPLTDGMKVEDSGTVAGKIHLFRIRSPFGSDALYGFADCGAVNGLTVEAECRGECKTAEGWPYEWSFTGFGYDESAAVKIRILMNGHEIAVLGQTLEGGTSGIGEVSADPIKTRPQGIYTIDGRKISKITAPGVYIVNGKKIVNR